MQALTEEEERHILIADHAGSGKTLAYLIPVIQRLKALERETGGRASKPGHPFAIIVLPTAELCTQVCTFLPAVLCHH